jgi:long-chain acyl-CoA synthetase
VLVTGEAFPVEVKRRLQARWPKARMYSFFAMTEGGAVTSLGPDEQLTHGTTVGRPLPGVEVRLVDDKDQDVPVGEVGEILIRSGEPGRYTIMRGYYHRPEADAEAFVDGFLRTGDLGRFDADGYLTIVDRKKDMILSGGLNVYSKEVERALESHPAVAEAAVIGIADRHYGEAVCAYVILNPGASATAEELIAHCRTLIASYKKPRQIRFVESLPRNSVGKVVKTLLR